MEHIIYKITNRLNGRFYIGMHSTKNINDGYLGSGRRIKAEVKKYGKENFEKVVLEHCVSREVLAAREAEIVTPELRADPLCLNLKDGGFGGFDNDQVTSTLIAKYGKDYFKRIASQQRGDSYSKDRRRNVSEALKLSFAKNGSPNLGKVREKVQCPHCDKSGAMNTMSRFHFDNCKFLKRTQQSIITTLKAAAQIDKTI